MLPDADVLALAAFQQSQHSEGFFNGSDNARVLHVFTALKSCFGPQTGDSCPYSSVFHKKIK